MDKRNAVGRGRSDESVSITYVRPDPRTSWTGIEDQIAPTAEEADALRRSAAYFLRCVRTIDQSRRRDALGTAVGKAANGSYATMMSGHNATSSALAMRARKAKRDAAAPWGDTDAVTAPQVAQDGPNVSHNPDTGVTVATPEAGSQTTP
jgi:hypothetical protein